MKGVKYRDKYHLNYFCHALYSARSYRATLRQV